MPNWCSNGLTLTHNDPSMILRAKTALEAGNFFQEFVPCPKDLLETTSGFLGNTEEQQQLEEQVRRNVDKYGYSSWYDFNVANWGTKWDCGASEVNQIDETMIKTSYDSAWAPPIAFYSALEGLGFDVEAYYYEPGMAFAGKYTQGQDEYYEFAEETSRTVREVVGEEIDDYFCISESMSEWEDDRESEISDLNSD